MSVSECAIHARDQPEPTASAIGRDPALGLVHAPVRNHPPASAVPPDCLRIDHEIAAVIGPLGRQAAGHLVRSRYHDIGIAAAPRPEQWDGFCNLPPCSLTLVAHLATGDLVGTVTTAPDSPMGIPADELYQAEIDTLRSQGRRVSEFISLANLPGQNAAALRRLLGLFRAAYLTAWDIQSATDLIVTVHPHHADFYRNQLRFVDIGEERSYAKVNGAAAVCLRLDLMTADTCYAAHHGQGRSLHRHFFTDTAAIASVREHLHSAVAAARAHDELLWIGSPWLVPAIPWATAPA